MFRPLVVGLLSLVSISSASADARWKKVSSQVHVDPISNEFRVEQRWHVTGATKAQLLKATKHLSLSGRYGVYGERKLLTTTVPEAEQNKGRGADAWAHPIFVPSSFGARARTVPTEHGFHASMSEGALGQGHSPVTIHEMKDGTTEIVEHGTYSLKSSKTGFAPFDLMYRLGAATVGRVALVAAHKGMGELHNKMFNAAEPLVNWVNDHPE